MRAILPFLILLSTSFSTFSQTDLDAKESCDLTITEDNSALVIAEGSKDCTKFKLDKGRDYTLQVYSKENPQELIYQATVVSGRKHGAEIFIIDGDKVVQLYNQGQLVPCTISFYSSGELKFKQDGKKAKEFSKDGRLIKKHILNKDGTIKKTISVGG